MRPLLVAPWVALVLFACGEKTPSGGGSSPENPAAPVDPSAAHAPFHFDARPGARAGRPLPVRLVGDARDVTIEVVRAADPADLLPRVLFPEGPPVEVRGERVYEGESKPGEWIPVPAPTAGLYQITARRDGEERSLVVAVTNLALVVKRSFRETLVFVADAETGVPVPAARVGLLGESGRRDGAADATGVFRTTFDPGPREAVMAVTDGGFALAVAERPAAGPAALTAWVDTDLAAAAPGEGVRFHAVVREATPDGWRPAETEGARFVVTDARGTVIAAGEAESDRPGSARGSFAVPAAAAAGAARIEIRIGDESAGGPLRILPSDPPPLELSIDAPSRAVVGEAVRIGIAGSYPGGGPVVGTKIRYRAERVRDDGRAPEVVLEGEGVPDASGRLHAHVTPDRPGEWIVSAAAGDPGEEPVEVEARVTVRAAGFLLSLRPRTKLVSPGEEVRVEVGAEFPAGDPHPVEGVMELAEDEVPFRIDPAAGGGPVATLAVLPSGPGPLRLVARARDAGGRTAEARCSVFVLGGADGAPGDGIEVRVDRDEVLPGGEARLLVRLPKGFEGATLLVTVEGRRLGPHAVETLSGAGGLLEIPVPPGLGGRVLFAVAAVRDDRVLTGAAAATVGVPSRRLSVTVETAAGEDGKTLARLAVADDEGRPVAARADLVAEAEPGLSRAPVEAVFAPGDALLVSTATSFAGPNGTGAKGAAAAAPAPGPVSRPAPPLVWLPDVEVPAGGLSLPLPIDEATGTFALAATVVTPDGRVGTGRTRVVRTRPLDLRLYAPPFLVAGDVAVVRAAAANGTGEDLAGTLEFRGEGLFGVDESRPEVTLPADGLFAEVPYTVSATRPGTGRIRAELRTQDGPSATAECEIPVLPRGFPDAATAAGRILERREVVALELPPGTLPAGSRIRIHFSAGPLAAVVRAAAALADTPAGDAEDEWGRILPAALAAARFPPDGKEEAPPELGNVAALVRNGQAALTALVREDGGFGLGPEGASDPAATARILSGLPLVRASGYEPPDSLVRRATERLETALDAGLAESDPTAAAIAIRVLSEANGSDSPPSADGFPPTDQLPDTAVADLLRAHFAAGRRAEAALLLTRLERRERRDAHGRSWWGDAEAALRTEDPVLATAAVVRALCLLPDLGDTIRVSRAIRFLLDRRQGAGWGSPRRTAAACLALLAAGNEEPESPDEVGVRIRIGDAIAASVRLDPGRLVRSGETVDVPGEYLSPGRNRVTFETASADRIDYSVRADLLVAPGRSRPRDPSVRVLLDLGRGGPAAGPLEGAAHRGESLEATVTVTTGESLRRVWVEIPVPAGAVIFPGGPADASLPPGARVFRERARVRFFLPRLEGRVRLGLVLRTIFAGRFAMLPASVREADQVSPRAVSAEGILYVE